MTRLLIRHTARASALWLLTFACNGTETDNPVAGEGQEPRHESPLRFEPAPSPPGCVPDLADAPPRDLPLWGVSGDYLVGLDSGLVVVDVSNRQAPALVARHALHGEPRQLVVEGTNVTLVVDELPMFEAPPVPAPAALDPVTRLIRFDLSDPSAPVRVADVALDNEFWRLVPRAGSYWVMSARVAQPAPSCELSNPYGCDYVEREALVLERYAFEAGAFAPIEQAELPMTNRAFSTPHGFAAGARTDAGGVLSIARFDDGGALAAPQSIAFDGELTPYAPIYIGPERTAFFASGLHVGEATGAPSASVTSVNGDVDARFTERGVFVQAGDSSSPVTFIDWSDLGALRSSVLTGVSHLLPIPSATGGAETRALGWQESAAGATFSLLALDTASVSVLGTLAAELTPESSPISAQLDASQAFLLGRVGGARSFMRIGFAGDELDAGGPLFQTYAQEIVSSDGWVYGVGLGSVEARAVGGESSARLELQAEVADVATSGSAEAALLRSLDGRVRLAVTSAGATQSINVSVAAERVLAAGDRWVVLSARSELECAQLGPGCEGHVPHVAIAGGEPLAVIEQLPLPSALPSLGPLGRAEERWAASSEYGAAPLSLGDGRWVLTRELSATCLTESDCETLGIDYVPISEANVNAGQQQDCPPPDTSSMPCNTEPLPEPTVYGTTTRRSYFVLDAATGTFSGGVDVETEGDMFWSTALWSGPRRSNDVLIDLRIEALERVGGTPRRVRFWLDRLSVAGSNLTRETPLPIPGYPIGLIDATTLLTAQPEPGETGSGLLHRVQLEDDRAEIESSLQLDARYGDVRIVGAHAIYVKLPTTSCDPETALEAISLGGPELEAASAPTARLALPGLDWQILAVVEDQLVVSRQGRAFARIRVGAAGELSLEAFATAPWYVQNAFWSNGALHGTSRDGVVRLAL